MVYMGKVQLGVETVIAPAGKEYPAGVQAPVVEAFRILAVGFIQGEGLARFHIHHPKVGLRVPDGETAVVADGVEHETAIV